MMRTIKMTLNIIITPIIITHAQGFECITKFFGEGYLAAPYCSLLTGHQPSSISPAHASLHSPLLSIKSNELRKWMKIIYLIATFASFRATKYMFHLEAKVWPVTPRGWLYGCMLYGSLKWMQRQILTKLLTIVTILYRPSASCWLYLHWSQHAAEVNQKSKHP